MAKPTGVVIAFAGASAPSGYLLCDGSAVSRTTYATLFALIGETYGVGDGSTTFNLPNVKGRAIAGKGAGTGYTALGATGGAKTVDLSHSHTANDHTHTASGTTSGGSAANTLGSDNGSTMPTSGHTHSWSTTTGTQSNKGSDTQLSSTQSILNPLIVENFAIKI